MSFLFPQWSPLTQRQSQHLIMVMKAQYSMVLPLNHGQVSSTSLHVSQPGLHSVSWIPGDMPALVILHLFFPGMLLLYSTSLLKCPPPLSLHLHSNVFPLSPSLTILFKHTPPISLFPFPTIFFSPKHLTSSKLLHILHIYIVYCLSHIKLLNPRKSFLLLHHLASRNVPNI